ncbi:hypothetical protein [Bacillus siamensis]|uniref:hypothetical protein n=1 Tax=Bacillus siamensis TaxID=659243 RepID=UPI0029170BFC|nr:hypothetical protein [Bacillus siamensis]
MQQFSPKKAGFHAEKDALIWSAQKIKLISRCKSSCLCIEYQDSLILVFQAGAVVTEKKE